MYPQNLSVISTKIVCTMMHSVNLGSHLNKNKKKKGVNFLGHWSMKKSAFLKIEKLK